MSVKSKRSVSNDNSFNIDSPQMSNRSIKLNMRRSSFESPVALKRMNAYDTQCMPSISTLHHLETVHPDLNSILKAVEDLGSRFEKMDIHINKISSEMKRIQSRMERVAGLKSDPMHNKMSADELRSRIEVLIDSERIFTTKENFIDALRLVIDKKKDESSLKMPENMPSILIEDNNVQLKEWEELKRKKDSEDSDIELQIERAIERSKAELKYFKEGPEDGILSAYHTGKRISSDRILQNKQERNRTKDELGGPKTGHELGCRDFSISNILIKAPSFKKKREEPPKAESKKITKPSIQLNYYEEVSREISSQNSDNEHSLNKDLLYAVESPNDSISKIESIGFFHMPNSPPPKVLDFRLRMRPEIIVSVEKDNQLIHSSSDLQNNSHVQNNEYKSDNILKSKR